ncbi:MAG TPA: hypothetical protein VIX86_09050 [Streptosporangiaceae bacterium]
MTAGPPGGLDDLLGPAGAGGPGGQAGPGGPGGQAGPGAAGAPAPGGQGGPSAGAGGLFTPQARRRWYVAIGATAGLGVLAAVVLISVPGSNPATHPLAADCGLVNCGAALPAAITTVSPQASPGQPGPRRHRHRRHALVPVPSPEPLVTSVPPSPTQAAKPPPPPALAVSVTYSPAGQDQWGRFSTQLTIANHGSRPVSGWTLQLSYPGDQVFWVGYQGFPDGWHGNEFVSWQFGGGTLTLTAQAGGETLAPGAAQTITIFGDGNAQVPAGCTFDGAACSS